MSADATFLRNGIASMNAKDKELFRTQYQKNEKGLIFLFVGQIVKRKGVGLLLQAWKNIVKIIQKISYY